MLVTVTVVLVMIAFALDGLQNFGTVGAGLKTPVAIAALAGILKLVIVAVVLTLLAIFGISNSRRPRSSKTRGPELLVGRSTEPSVSQGES